MKEYKKTFNGIPVIAYNDSNCDWVVRGIDPDGIGSMRFPKSKFTMKYAMVFYTRLALAAA